MDGIFGIGIPEILIVVVLALIILGPQDMVKTARKLGRWVYRVYHSPTWRMIMSTSQELREVPTKFVREAGLEDTVEEIKQTTANVKSQLKEATGDVSAELKQASLDASAGLKEATGDVSAELKEARQQLGPEAQSAAALAQPEAVLTPAAPDPVPIPAPGLDSPAPVLLADPDGDGNNEAPSTAAQPVPFTPWHEPQPEAQDLNPEEFTI